jgi:peptide-methionine (S)-S-oxide reductase
MLGFKTTTTVDRGSALSGRAAAIRTAGTHFVFGRALNGDVPVGKQQAMFGMGCFWGVERVFWRLEGVWMTRAGYAAGFTPNPTYQELCTGQTGHNEVVHLVFDPAVLSYEMLLKTFWEGHDPTQGMAPGNDPGNQYRSGIYTYGSGQAEAAEQSKHTYGERLSEAGMGPITTEVLPAPEFYHAEGSHQQYLAKNPGGFCGLGGTGVSCPVGVGTA